MLNLLGPVMFLVAMVPHVGAMLLGRHLVLRHAGVPFRALRIDGSVWRKLDWRRRIGSFLVPVLLDVVAVGALLLVTGFALPAMTTESVVEPVPDGAAAAAGVQAGDRVVRVEGTPVSTFIEMRDAIAEAATKSDVLRVELERAGVNHTLEIKHRSGRLGVRPVMRSATFTDAVSYAVGVPKELFRLVRELLSSSPSVRLGGPKEIAETVAQAPTGSRTSVLLMLLSTLAVYTFWLVPLLCLIGTPWRAVWTGKRSGDS